MKINGFRLEEKLKETEFVSVFRATQEALDRAVLLKVIKSQFASDEKVLQRLRQEARAIAKISHPNVVQVYDFGEDDGQIYIAMEYFPSRDFEQVLTEEGPVVSVSKGLHCLEQVLRGLNAVHAQGIFHRDIKPANLLVNGNNEVKITDFGLANLKGTTGVTIEGGIVGTPRYMSPEQISGAKPSPQSEIFSVGVTFYELLTGVSPFEADSYSAVFNKILNDDPTQASELRAEIPLELGEILHRMMAKDTGNRYESCEEILADLGQLSDYRGPGAVTPSKSDTEIAPRKTVKKWLPGVAAMVLIPVFVAIFYWLSQNESVPVSTVEKNQPQVTETEKEAVIPEEKAPDKLESTQISISKSEAEALITEPAEDIVDNALPVSDKEKAASVESPGKLWVGVIPWAAVYVNGDSVGISPMQDTVELEPGTYPVTLRHPEFPAYRTNVEIQSGITSGLRVDLSKESGFLSLAVYPWAKVFVDGEFIDTTPLPEPMVINPGRHLVQLKHPDFADWQTYVNITKGDTITLKVRL